MKDGKMITAGKGALIQIEKSATLGTSQDQTVFVPIKSICLNDQGGGGNVPIVLAAFEGNGARPSHKGSGFNDGEKMFTLNGTEVHGVVCKN